MNKGEDLIPVRYQANPNQTRTNPDPTLTTNPTTASPSKSLSSSSPSPVNRPNSPSQSTPISPRGQPAQHRATYSTPNQAPPLTSARPTSLSPTPVDLNSFSAFSSPENFFLAPTNSRLRPDGAYVLTTKNVLYQVALFNAI